MKITFSRGERCDHRDCPYVLLGCGVFRNGSWNARYTSGLRLFYFYITPILCDWELFNVCVEFPTLWLKKTEHLDEAA